MTGSGRPGRVLVVGSSNTDLVCQTDRLPRPGETVASFGFAIYPGGKAANQAVAASRAGASVAFVGGFGGDEYGRDRRQELVAEGINLTHSRIFDEEPSGLALIAVDRAGENLIVTVGGANDRVTVEQLDEALDASEYDVLLLPNEAPVEVVARAVTGHGGATVVLNAAPFEENLRSLVDQFDVLICNAVEAAQFLGREPGAQAPEADVEELARLCRGSAVITLGATGAVGWTNGSMHRVPALDVHVVDTTGAGDAFCGAFAAWIARGSGFADALAAGGVAGSLATTSAGAQPSLPDQAAISEYL